MQLAHRTRGQSAALAANWLLRPRMQFLKWKNMREASSELVSQFGCSSSDKGIVCGFGRTGDVGIPSAEIAHAVNAKAWQ
ncbi:hypothetical protein EFR24_04470 [Lactobacillus delbrueckii subsp. lactis]|nr:hypothetical protein LDD39_07840 [Lactobacillus delbrueckii subsp. delbrueckii]MCT3503725.1 hypothetical protein [Lactobacillus delbrueckii subsp. lactis]MCT3507119.1 hypothetical protein [Lactobacillus delbrueckii subsp. lactis]MCT3524114.1 hypothetical protein [Lactobacillus delbrueckii subsp. lactis]